MFSYLYMSQIFMTWLQKSLQKNSHKVKTTIKSLCFKSLVAAIDSSFHYKNQGVAVNFDLNKIGCLRFISQQIVKVVAWLSV